MEGEFNMVFEQYVILGLMNLPVYFSGYTHILLNETQYIWRVARNGVLR